MVVLIFVGLVMCADAGLGDLDLESQRYASLIASDTGKAATYGATVIVPIDLVNGGVAANFLRTSVEHEGESIVSDDFQYRLQGGPEWKGATVQFYVEGDRGKHQDRGVFLRPGSLDVQGWHISGGVGTYIRGLHEELRLDEDEPETLVKPIAFASLTHKLGQGILSVLVTWSPTFDLEAHDLLVEPQFKVSVGKADLVLTGRFGEQHDMTVRDYIAQVDFPF